MPTPPAKQLQQAGLGVWGQQRHTHTYIAGIARRRLSYKQHALVNQDKCLEYVVAEPSQKIYTI